MGSLSPLELEALGDQNVFVVVEDIYLTRWFTAIALTIICYDNLLTLDDEIAFIWPKRWNSVKILTYSNRAVALTFIALNTHHLVGVTNPLSNHLSVHQIYETIFSPAICSCSVVLVATGYGALVSFAMCNWILLARAQALVGTRPFLNNLLTTFYIASYLITTALVTHTSWILRDKIFYSDSFHVCGIPMHPSSMGFIWLAPLVFETAIFLLTIVKLYENAVEDYSLGSTLLVTLYRDGVAYYLVIFSLRVFNLLAWQIMPIQFALIGIFLLWAIMSVSVTRLQLNLLKAVNMPPASLEITSVGPSISIFASFPRRNGSRSQTERSRIRTSRMQLRTFSHGIAPEP